jgi:propanol-preferring alcohol dehydrogenase
MSPLPEIPYETLWGERTLTSVANSTRQDVRDLLRLAAEIPLHTEVDVQPLEDANGALLRMKRSEIRGAAVLRVGEL